jgi:hypothetical protein
VRSRTDIAFGDAKLVLAVTTLGTARVDDKLAQHVRGVRSVYSRALKY